MVPCHQYYFLEHMSRHAPINIIDVTFWQNTAVCKPFLVPMIHFLVTNYLFSNWFQLGKRNDANYTVSEGKVFFFNLALKEGNIQVRLCLKVILKS